MFEQWEAPFFSQTVPNVVFTPLILKHTLQNDTFRGVGHSIIVFMLRKAGRGSSVGRERATPGEGVLGSNPLWPPAPYWLGRCQSNVTG